MPKILRVKTSNQGKKAIGELDVYDSIEKLTRNH